MGHSKYAEKVSGQMWRTSLASSYFLLLVVLFRLLLFSDACESLGFTWTRAVAELDIVSNRVG